MAPRAPTLRLLRRPAVTGAVVRYVLACTAAACHVTVQLIGPHGVRLGLRHVTIAAGRHLTRTIALNARGRRLLRARRALAATLHLGVPGASAAPRPQRITFYR